MNLGDFAENDAAANAASSLAQKLLRSYASKAVSVAQRDRRTLDRLNLYSSWHLGVRPSLKAKSTPRPELLLGVGVAVHSGNEYPMVLVNSSGVRDVDSGKTVHDVSDIPEVEDELGEHVGHDEMHNYKVRLVEPPEPQYFPGDEVHGLGTRGTLGAGVSVNGTDAILTAGHVAQGATTVKNSGGVPGQVLVSIDPSSTGSAMPMADVAVIQPARWATASTIQLSGTSSAVQGGTEIEIHGLSGVQSATVMGFTPFLHVPSMAGQWGDLYFTTAGVTAGGDSGAPVVLKGTDSLIGHLVGASGSTTSYIQTITLQLSATSAIFRPTP